MLSAQIGSYSLVENDGLVCLQPADRYSATFHRTLQELETQSTPPVGCRSIDLFTQTIYPSTDSVYSLEYTPSVGVTADGMSISEMWRSNVVLPELPVGEATEAWPSYLKEDTIRALTALSRPLHETMSPEATHAMDIACTWP